MAAILGGADILSTVLDLAGEQDYVAGLLTAAGGHRAFDRAVDGSSRRLALWGAASGVAAGLLATGIGRAASTSGRLEQIEIGLKTITGSAETATAQMAEFQEFAQRSPFNLAEVAQGARQLQIAGIRGEALTRTLEGIGNAAAAAGGNQNEVFAGVVRAVSQIQTNGRLYREELNQLTERGIPAAQILQEELGLTGEQMRKVGQEGIEANVAVDALIRGFQKRFSGAMEEQSRTLFGSWSSLQDAGEQLLNTLGQPVNSPFTQVVRGTTDLLNLLAKMPPPLATIISHGAVLGVVGLGAAAVISAVKLRNLNAENSKLLNESLKAKGGADQERTAEDLLAGALGRAGMASALLAGHTRTLEAAHLAAARAAGIQAAAAGGIGRGVPTTAGGRAVTVPAVRPVPTILPNTAQAGINAAALAAEHAKMSAANIRTAPFDTGALAAGHAARAAAAQAAQKTAMGDTAALFPGGAGGAKTGMLAKAGGLLKGKGTVAGIVAEVAGHLLLNQLPDEGAAGGFKRIGQGALTGAGIGATIGSFVPGIGTVAGGTAGAIIGGGLAAVGEQQAGAADTDAKKLLAATEKQNEYLAKIAEAVDRQGKFPVSTDFVPGSMQVPILRALGKAL